MIRIIRGTYGFRGSDGLIHPKTYADGPFEESAEQEKKLIRLGVAEAVEEAKTPVQKAPAAAKKEAKNVRLQRTDRKGR